MAPTSSFAAPQHLDFDDAAIDRSLEAARLLTRDSADLETFFRGFLPELRRVMSAQFAAVWLVGHEQAVHRTASSGQQTLAADVSLSSVQQVIKSGRGSHCSSGGSQEPSSAAGLLSPLADAGIVMGVLEVHWASPMSENALPSYAELQAAFADIATESICRQQSREFRQQGRTENFVASIHQSLGLEHTSYTVANEGRRFSGCDRLSVIIQRRGQFRTRAVSGLDTVDSRSDEIRQLERLASVVGATEQPLWFDGDASDQPPQVERLVQGYVDASCARTVAILPLGPRLGAVAGSDCCGALVFERFEGGSLESTEREVYTAVAENATPALRSALLHESLPLLWLSRLIQRIGRLLGGGRLALTLLSATIAVLLVVSSVLIPADLRITCRGQLQPVSRREIFAPSDGAIELKVDYGDRVRKGDLLLVLHNPELDYEQTRVLGEIQTTETQLRAWQASAISADREPREAYQRGAEQERLKELLRGLRRQRDVLQRQRRELRVTSPIDGQVLTWNARATLQSRPVGRGQQLLSIVDPDGPWEAEVEVADRDVGYVLAARQDSQRLPAEFVQATDPGQVHRGTVGSIAVGSEAHEGLGASVTVKIRVDRGAAFEPRPGAEVVAKIDCGPRSVAFVWLRQLIDLMRTRVLF